MRAWVRGEIVCAWRDVPKRPSRTPDGAGSGLNAKRESCIGRTSHMCLMPRTATARGRRPYSLLYRRAGRLVAG